jgi:hypothetical protein
MAAIQFVCGLRRIGTVVASSGILREFPAAEMASGRFSRRFSRQPFPENRANPN